MDPISTAAGLASIGSFIFAVWAHRRKDRGDENPDPSPIVVQGVTEFTNSDKDYLAWLQGHPQGFVINTPRGMPANDMVLHKASCSMVSRYRTNTPPGAFAERGYVKVCSNDINRLQAWAKAHGRKDGTFSSDCGICRPDSRAGPNSKQPNIDSTPPPYPSPVVLKTEDQSSALSSSEYAALLSKCQSLPMAKGHYLIDDYVENLLLTVLDFMMQTKVVERSQGHYLKRVKPVVQTHQNLKDLLASFPNTEDGNRQIARHLWGYNHWKRVELLRDLVAYFEALGVTTQAQLREWAQTTKFEDFEGKVKGLGPTTFNWLVMRQGVETIKLDTHVRRFMQESVNHSLSDADMISVLQQVANNMGIKAYELDWRIWEYQRSLSPAATA